MSKDHQLEFHCLHCKHVIAFSIMQHKSATMILNCAQCQKKYCFDDATILRQLKQFEDLCRQIHASKEILGSTSVAIDIGNHHVKVPFNILLTRLNSVIELTVENQRFAFSYRVEPLKDELFAISL